MRHRPITYILPDLPWEILHDAIVRDAPAGAVIEVHTQPMQALVERRLTEAGRTDIVLRLGGATSRRRD